MQAWSQRRHAGPGSATFAVGHGMGNWLIERFTLLGVTFQNWVILALAVILVGALIAWWRGQ